MEDGCSQSCLGSVDIEPQNISRLMAGPGTLAMYVELHLLTRYPLSQGHIWNEHILAKQSWRDCLFDEHAKSAFEMNPSEPDEKCYMNLAPLDDPEAESGEASKAGLRPLEKTNPQIIANLVTPVLVIHRSFQWKERQKHAGGSFLPLGWSFVAYS